jgi:branched-chain amino acid transport system permease protein
VLLPAGGRPAARWRSGWGLGGAGALLAAALALAGRRHGFGVADYVQFAVDGLQAGAIYALVALGFVVVHRVTGIINFAQGAFVMLGPMLTITFLGPGPTVSAARLAASALAAVTATGLLGVAIYRLALHPARGALLLTRIMITVGVYLVLQGAALLAWGPRPYVLPAFTTLEMRDRSLRVGDVLIRAQSLWIWGTAAALVVLLALFFERTLTGKAMRACAVNRLAAQLAGIRVDAMATLAFGLAAVLGAAAGIVVGPVTRPTFDMGLEAGLKGFVAAIMGGLVSVRGAIAGALILGVLETLWAGVTLAGFKDLFAFVVLVVLLLARPQGFAGAEVEAERP